VTKFKEGDRVKVVEDTLLVTAYLLGKEGTVVQVSPFCVSVILDGMEMALGFDAEELELI
jgi:hypothetical protein